MLNVYQCEFALGITLSDKITKGRFERAEFCRTLISWIMNLVRQPLHAERPL